MNRLILDDDRWPVEMVPGCHFVWFIEGHGTTLYSRVLQTPLKLTRPGHLLTVTFTALYPAGQRRFVRCKDACMLLSGEQFELARRLQWPQNEGGLRQIFDVQAN